MAAGPSSKNSKNLQRKTLKPDVTLVIYDGACPFCSAYVRLHRFREDIGPVELLSARAPDDRIAHYQQLGFDLDQGMLLVMGDVVHAGAVALNIRNDRLVRNIQRIIRIDRDLLTLGGNLDVLVHEKMSPLE